MSEENRETFFRRLEPFLAPSVLLDVQLAYTMAKYGHRAQVRKETDDDGTPVRYFEHVRRVAIVLVDEARVVMPEMIIAALLHDGIEDTRDLTPAMIEHCFGTDVVNLVKVLSKVPKEGYLDRFITCADWRPYLIKACDRLDNLRSLHAADRPFQTRQVAETRDKYFPLFDRMLAVVPPNHYRSAEKLRDLVRQETEKQNTLVQLMGLHEAREVA